MSIDKSIAPAPEGLGALATGEEPTIEIEVEMPGETDSASEEGAEAAPDFNANLVDELDAGEITDIATTLKADIDTDLQSRRDWEKMYTDGIALLGLKIEERTEPWPGACGVFHPMITEAVVRFQSETIMETFPAQGPVSTRIVGKQTPEKDEAAKRVKEDMNYQLTEVMPEFRSEHERMLFSLPGAGSAFKKVYWDPSKERQVSLFVPAEDVILPYGASDLNASERVTHRMKKTKNEIEALQEAGFWSADAIIPDGPINQVTQIQQRKDKESGVSAINDTRQTIYEAQVLLKLKSVDDGSDLALPYIVTMIADTYTVLAIRRNWKKDDELKKKRDHFVHYQYIPGFGAYGFGLFHLIGGYAKGATSILRQIVDAGTLANLPGGLKTRGLRIKGDDTPIAPGEFRDVDLGSGAIKDNIMTLPYKEPSQTLATVLDKIIEEGRRFASTADLKIADMSNQAPVGTTLAILERTLKVMSAVQARVHYAFKQELQLIAGLIRDYSDDEDYDYDVDSPIGRRAKIEDYSHVEIIPVSDPNAATVAQRVVQYQAVVQLAQQAPEIYDKPLLHRQMLEVLGIKNAAKLVPMAIDMKPMDPVSENQSVLIGKPVKAFAYQDHEAHIRVHMFAMQDPLMAQMIGQNPQAQAITQALAAHVAEHVGYAYRNRMAQALGIELPQVDVDEGYAPEQELQLSKMLAQAAPKVLAQSQAIVANQQAQQNQQDPALQIEMKNLDIKQGELERKKQKDAVEAAAEADRIRLAEEKLRLEREKAQSADEKDGLRIAGEIHQQRESNQQE